MENHQFSLGQNWWLSGDLCLLSIDYFNFDEARAYFANAEDTIMLIQTTGRCHLLAICVARDGTAMRNWVNSAYRTLPGIESINVHSVLEMIKGRIIPE